MSILTAGYYKLAKASTFSEPPLCWQPQNTSIAQVLAIPAYTLQNSAFLFTTTGRMTECQPCGIWWVCMTHQWHQYTAQAQTGSLCRPSCPKASPGLKNKSILECRTPAHTSTQFFCSHWKRWPIRGYSLLAASFHGAMATLFFRRTHTLKFVSCFSIAGCSMLWRQRNVSSDILKLCTHCVCVCAWESWNDHIPPVIGLNESPNRWSAGLILQLTGFMKTHACSPEQSLSSSCDKQPHIRMRITKCWMSSVVTLCLLCQVPLLRWIYW